MEVRHRIAAAIRETRSGLADAGIESADAEARALVRHAAQCERSLVLIDELPADFASVLEAAVQRRERREPLQLILGAAPFRRLSLEVRPGVFIPRPETELAIDLVHDFTREGEQLKSVVDLCTGSGTLAAAMTDEFPEVRVWALDISPAAVELARLNIERADSRRPGPGSESEVAGSRAHVVCAPVGEQLAAPGGLLAGALGADAVLSNPPYIPPAAVPRDPEVLGYDPKAALYGGGADGLAVPEQVMRTARALLRPGGLFVMEHADVQGQSARALLERVGGFEQIRTQVDLTGRDRFLVARRSAHGAAALRE